MVLKAVGALGDECERSGKRHAATLAAALAGVRRAFLVVAVSLLLLVVSLRRMARCCGVFLRRNPRRGVRDGRADGGKASEQRTGACHARRRT